MLQCVQDKKLLDKNPQCIPKSHTCMWRNVIMKMKTTNNLIFKLFNPLSTSSAKAFGSLFCAGTRHLYLVSSPQGLGTVFPLSICVAFCCKHILQYA